MKIRTWPKDHEVLRFFARPVEDIKSGRIQRIIDRMFKTKHRHGGFGLAANQVGLLQRIILVDKMAIINPVIEPDNSVLEETEDEACLSIPGVIVPVTRKVSVHVAGIDRCGEPLDFTVEGKIARCIQHEVAHLNGNLIIDEKLGMPK